MATPISPGATPLVMTAAGDVIIGGSGGLPQRLGIGVDQDALQVISGALAWGVLPKTQLVLTANVSLAAGTFTTVLTSPSLGTGYYLFGYVFIASNNGATAGYLAGQLGPGTGVGVFNGGGTGYYAQTQGELPALSGGCGTLSSVGLLQVTTAGTFVLSAQAGVAATVNTGSPALPNNGGTFLSFVKIA